MWATVVPVVMEAMDRWNRQMCVCVMNVTKEKKRSEGAWMEKKYNRKKNVCTRRTKTKRFSQRQCPSVSDQNQPAGLMFHRLWTKHTHLLLKETRQTLSFIIIHITHPHKVWLPDEEGVCMCVCVAVGALCVCIAVSALCL